MSITISRSNMRFSKLCLLTALRGSRTYSRESSSNLGGITKKASGKEGEPEIPQNPLTNIHTASLQTDYGKIYDKKPFKLKCYEGKQYFWCLCGQSKSQPICDGTHKNPYLKLKYRPVKFEVKETKEYWLCNCKQTSNRPFCDGTHKREDIQAAVK